MTQCKISAWISVLTRNKIIISVFVRS